MRRNIIIGVVVLGVLVLSQTSIFANSLGFSKGIMPDSPLYSVDIGVEKVQLYTAYSENQTAQLHLQFSHERLGELEYLTNQQDVSISNVIIVSDDYHENISQFNKIVVAKVNKQEKLDGDIKPQLEALQQTQNQIVTQINQSAQQEVKIIVKTAIKESQEALITAVETVKKPIADKQHEQENNNEDSEEASKIVEELDETLESLKTQKEELTQAIIADENELKETNGLIATENLANETANNPETADKVLVPTTADIIVINEVPQQWYYSTSCDFVSKNPGKDPVCGEELIPIESLPANHSFFTKYSYDEVQGKYIQKLQNAIETIENKDVKNANLEESAKETTPNSPDVTDKINPPVEEIISTVY